MKLFAARMSIGVFLVTSLWAAETAPATISGVVTDWDGVPFAHAAIKATSASGVQFQATSGAAGVYTLSDLPSGTYRLLIQGAGMKPFVKADVVLDPGQTLHLNARLEDFANLNTLGDGREVIENVFSKTHAVPSGPAPRLANGKPDLSGVWYSQRIVDLGHPELTAWAEKITRERQANDLRDAPSSRCLPFGITLSGLFSPFRIVETAKILLIIYEEELPRQIHLDGRPHPKDWDSTYDGHSVGHWEGDDLVVDTVGFNDRTWLDIAGHPHTENMHITERFRRPELGHLEIKTTIEDPAAYTKSWSMEKVSDLAPQTEEVGQNVCMENNQDVPHLVGK
jgi:hypothetical protein